MLGLWKVRGFEKVNRLKKKGHRSVSVTEYLKTCELLNKYALNWIENDTVNALQKETAFDKLYRERETKSKFSSTPLYYIYLYI